MITLKYHSHTTHRLSPFTSLLLGSNDFILYVINIVFGYM